MGSGEAADKATSPAAKAKLSAINPNWAQLQQKLKPRRCHAASGSKPSSIDSDTKTLGKQASLLAKRKERTEEPTPEELSPSSAALLAPTSNDFSLTKVLAMDCEMVGVSFEGSKSALGRVTLVNSWGNVVYDEYVRPMERIVDFRTRVSGIRPKNMKKAKDFWTAQKKVSELITGRILVGHSLRNDLKVLLLSHPKKDTRDSSEFEPFLRNGHKRKLKDLAAEILGVKIQEKEHCPIDDARAAMFLYNKHKKEWEKSAKEQLRFRKKLNNKTKKKETGMPNLVSSKGTTL